MHKKAVVFVLVSFVLGALVGVAFAKKTFDTGLYHDKSAEEAGANLLRQAEAFAENGSWENLAVARVYYLGGNKAEGQRLIDKVMGKKVEKSDWMRIGRIYHEAGEWDKAVDAFTKAIAKDPEDGHKVNEVGAYFLLRGDREQAERYFDQGFAAEPADVWTTVAAAAAYLGVSPQH